MSSSGTSDQPAGANAKAEQPAGVVSIDMPQMGVSVAEGTITEWLKRPGDWVEADETIAEVTTDKIDVEIPAPATGRLERVLVERGETVAVGTSLAEIDTSASPGEAHRDEDHGPAAREQEPAAPAAPPPSGNGHGVTEPPGAAEREADRSRFYSPVVRRIAEERGIDLSRIEGRGVGGRVRKADVLAYIEEQGGEPAEPPAEPVLHTESPYRPEEPREAPPREPEEIAPPAPAEIPSAEDLIGPSRREPMSPMRQAIAKHMVSSRHTAAHCTTVVEVDMSAVAARRRELKEEMARRGVPLTFLAFVAGATVEALREFPVLNASVANGEIAYHEDVNLGIAVALEKGLIVPVIRKAQRLSLEGMAAAIAESAERARSGRLQPDEVHGGTFTITNPGQFGAILATPIINQPQVAILDLEAIVKRPVVIEGSDGGSIAIRPMTNLCMSWDHRVLDGATAARFLAALKARLEGEGAQR